MPTSKSIKAPAFQFYAKEFLSSSRVMAMTMTERGVYITLLSVQWMDGTIPADMKALANLLKGVSAQQLARMWPANLAGAFVKRGDRLVNQRLEEERKKQADRRAQARENGNLGGRPKKGLGLQTETQDEAKKSSASAISDLQPAGTHRQGGAPIHGLSHRAHAACGRVCVHSEIHQEFIRALNVDDADKQLRDWYAAVDDEWSVGAKKGQNTGGNSFAFWRARFSERWPAPAATEKRAAGSARLPAWAVTNGTAVKP